MKKLFSILGNISLAMSLLFAQSALANCRDDITASTPDQDFTLHNDGTVTHNITGLMWMRCSLGQIWDGNTCLGSASTYNWVNAFPATQSYSFAEYSDWRLPSKNELASLVELRCNNPAINSTVFPNTPHIPNGLFWSSTPSASYSNSAFYVDFTYGSAWDTNKGISWGRVRLVRAVQ